MSRPRIQPGLRASLCYLGSAVFLTTGAVTIADQPFNVHKAPFCHCQKSQQGGKPANCTTGVTCWGVGPCSGAACKWTIQQGVNVACTC